MNRETPTIDQPSDHDSAQVGRFFDAYADDWNANYAEPGRAGRAFDYLNRQQLALRLVRSNVSPGGKLLELGCGAGHTATELCARGYRVTCLDVSERMIETTRSTLQQAGCSADLHLGTIHDLPSPPDSFDAIVALGVMDYVPDPAATVARIHQLLKPGGWCLLSFTNAGTPLRWVEIPLKRAAAGIAYLFSRSTRYRDVALNTSVAHRAREVRRWYAAAGLSVEGIEYFSYGIRLGSFWCPPLWCVRKMDRVLARGPLAALGRGFIAIGKKST